MGSVFPWVNFRFHLLQIQLPMTRLRSPFINLGFELHRLDSKFVKLDYYKLKNFDIESDKISALKTS